MDYITETRMFLYNEDKHLQQESLESYINECIILAENSNAISNLKAFNEAENKSFGQKVKDAFKKFIDFIKQIFGKFVSRLQRFVQGNKKWLEKNKAIILNNPFKYEDVTTYNYSEGIKRMVNAAIPAFDNYNNIKDNLTSDKACYEWMAKSINFGNFAYDENVKFIDSVSEFFRGGKDQIVIPGNKLNLSDIYNYCYDYQNMTEGIKKDQKTLETALDNISKEIDKKAATMTADSSSTGTQNNSNQSSSNNSTNSSNNNSAEQQDKPITDVKEENAVFSNVYGTYFTEADGPSFGASKDSSSSGPQMKASNGPGNVGSQDATAASNMKNVNYNGKSSEDVQKQNTENINNSNTSELKAMSEACLRYRTAASAVFSAKLNVAEKCYKDYLKILIAHVDSYTGRDKKNNKETDAPTDYRNTDEYKNLSSEEQTSVDKNINGIKNESEKQVANGQDITKAVNNTIDKFVSDKSISKKTGDAIKQMVSKATGSDLLTKLKNISSSYTMSGAN